MTTNIGITLAYHNDHRQLFYGSGVSQNAKFLYDLIELLGYQPLFLTEGDCPNNQIEIRNKTYRAVSLNEVYHKALPLQLIIELGFSINPHNQSALERKVNPIFVQYSLGNQMFLDFERVVYGLNHGRAAHSTLKKEIWQLPHFRHSKSYLEIVKSTPIKTCPFIWEPDFISLNFDERAFCHQPNIIVMEPNQSMLKCGVFGMSVIEHLYRNSPDSFNEGRIHCASRFSDQSYLRDSLLSGFSSYQDGRLKLAGRLPLDEVFHDRHVLLGNQHMWELNNLYFEAIYANIPLVHNSAPYKSVGYYYEEFDAYSATDKVLEAIKDSDLETYRYNGKSFLERYSIHNTEVQESYRSLIETSVKRS